MATGKYLSLEEARKNGSINRFAKEHQSKGSKTVFDKMLDLMARTPGSTGRTSSRKRRGEG